MDHNEEYHDPDYAGTSIQIKVEPPSFSEEEKVEKIKCIIQKEFSNEIEIRENEVVLADQRMSTARRMLHRLRYALVSGYYQEQKLQLTAAQIQNDIAVQSEPRAKAEVSAIARAQRRLHPSVRKLVGARADCTRLDDIFRGMAPRARARPDYSAMIQSRNYTIPADATQSLRPGAPPPDPAPEGLAAEIPAPAPASPGSADESPGPPAKAPRRPEPPPPTHVLTLDEGTRNRTKHRYRIIIGNTSKYAPGASAADRSTHKWLLYVRAPPQHDAARVLAAVVFRLHPSYAPHHVVTVTKPPFHISRRGWGEFPATVELHFPLPARNRPATVTHTIKLDRHYTGFQTLGAETLVDVWLYSTPEMLEFEYKEEPPREAPAEEREEREERPEPVVPKREPGEEPEPPAPADSWLDFFTADTTELDVDEMIIKPEKKRSDVEKSIENDEPCDVKPALDLPIDIADIKIETNDWTTIDRSIENPSETMPNEILSEPESPRKRIMKYLDPKTGKIYYLEMDRTLDLSKVQEIVINSKGNVKTAKLSPVKNGVKNVKKTIKKGVSLLKPEVKNLLNTKEKQKLKNFSHIQNDHCYVGAAWAKNVNFTSNTAVQVKRELGLYEALCGALARFSCVRMAVNYLCKKIPVVSDQARDPAFTAHFPFVVDSDERFWKMDFAKRRNKEWSRAKLINTMLHEHLNTPDQIWSTKQILIFSRLHGYHPTRQEAATEDSSWNQPEIRSTLSIFNPEEFSPSLTEEICVSDDEDVDIVCCDPPVTVKRERSSSANLTVLPVTGEDRERFLFVERKCADIGVELRNEDVGNGYSYSAVHAVLVAATRCFAEELIRSALCGALLEGSAPAPPEPEPSASAEPRLPHLPHDQPPTVWTRRPSAATSLSPARVAAGAARLRSRAALLTARGLAARRADVYHI